MKSQVVSMVRNSKGEFETKVHLVAENFEYAAECAELLREKGVLAIVTFVRDED